jgi:C-terminal peptidase prc
MLRGRNPQSALKGYLLTGFVSVILVCNGCGPAHPVGSVPGTGTQLETFFDSYTKVKKYFVDPVVPAQLSTDAIHGMDQWVSAKHMGSQNTALALPAAMEKEEAALKAVEAAYTAFLQDPSLDPRRLEYAAIRGMMKGLDPHSYFMEPDTYREIQVETKGKFAGTGLQIGRKKDRIVVIAPLEGSPAEKAGIKSGDYLLSINNESILGLTLVETIERLRGPIGSQVKLTFERDGEAEPRSFEFIREVIKLESVHSKLFEGSIGYVRITQIQDSTPKNLNDTISAFQRQGIKALILDLRNNPGGLLTASVDVTEQFLEQGKLIVSLKGRVGERDVSDEYRSRSKKPFLGIPLVVLVNRGTAAGSEIIAGALQGNGRAKVIGEPTFGQGTVQTVLPLLGGAGLRLTTARFFTPSEHSIEAMRIQPDILVEDRPGTDAPMSAALAELRPNL